MLSEHDAENFTLQIYAAAPLFFRFKTEGYLDLGDIPTAEDLDVCERYGLEIPPFVPERKYPVIHYWGIECWSGWLSIVLDAAIKMEALLTEMMTNGVARDDLPGCVQIKEKFGELRIYWRAVDGAPVTPHMQEVIEDAARRAALTCTRCGAPGFTRPGLGIAPLCDACAETVRWQHKQDGLD